jgi:hypothetical protein
MAERGSYVFINRKEHYIFLNMWDLPLMITFPGHNPFNPVPRLDENETNDAENKKYERKRKRKETSKEERDKIPQDDLYALMELSHLSFRATEDDIKTACNFFYWV